MPPGSGKHLIDRTLEIPRPTLIPPILRPEPPVPLPDGSILIVTDDQSIPPDGAAGGRIDPLRSESGWTWAHEQPNVTVMALWLERSSGHGEDAQPSFLFDPALGTGLLATYDGTGGSGSAPVRTSRSGRELSGAFLAARLARRATEAWFAGSLEGPRDETPPEVELHDALQARFAAEFHKGLSSSDKFAGSLRRELPTTLAAAAFHAEDHTLSIASLWAGDSRCHLLTPSGGLQQLTIDDSPVTDALESIITDAPMTNVICADREFTVHRRNFETRLPALLISSTDGCFGYVATPAHYEYLLLQGLQSATSVQSWGRTVLDQLDNFTADDASLVIAAFGWPDFDSLKQSFQERTATLRVEHWEPFTGLDLDDRDQLTLARQASWRSYRHHYERYLPPPEAPATGTDGNRGSP